MASEGLTPTQIELIKACVPILAEHGKTITSVFYKNMLNEHKELNNVFNQTHQTTGHQAQALACAVFAYAKYIDNLGVLGEAVERIAQKHCSLYITPEQYGIVGTHLLAAMKEVLGDALTQDIHDAWAAAYWQLANILIGREKQLYDGADGWTNWRDFIVDKKVKESEEVTSFYLKPKDGKALPTFLPGQYISVQIDVPELKYLQSRQYSLSTAPNKEYYRISVKKEFGNDAQNPKNPGWISNKLHNDLKEGDTIQVSYPRGEFFLDTKKNPTSPVVLLSAGVGITPLMSMLETLVQEKSEKKVSWIHATRSCTAQPFVKHLEDILKIHPAGHSTIFNKDPKDDAKYNHKGRMVLEVLDKEKDLFLNDKTTEYYICGPERFMVETASKLKEYGVEEGRIKYELFSTGGVPSS